MTGVAQTRVTKLERDPEGHWTARVTVGGLTRPFHARHGSWVTDRQRGDDWPANVTMREASALVREAIAARLPKRGVRR